MRAVSSNQNFVTRQYFFFFNDTATTEIYTLSLHDALPILKATGSPSRRRAAAVSWEKQLIPRMSTGAYVPLRSAACQDRKSTRLNSSHLVISYAVFCLKKKKKSSCVNYKK